MFLLQHELATRSRDDLDEPQPLDPRPIDNRSIRRIGPDNLLELDRFAERLQGELRADAVLHVGGRDAQRPHQTKRINDQVPLAAEYFFSRVVAAWPALLGRLDGLAVEDRRGGLRRSPRLPADAVAELRVKPLPRVVRLPLAEPVEHDPVRREVVRQGTPSTAVARDVEDRVADLTLGVLRRPAGGRIARDPGLHPSPLVIRKVRRVGRPAHAANNWKPLTTTQIAVIGQPLRIGPFLTKAARVPK